MADGESTRSVPTNATGRLARALERQLSLQKCAASRGDVKMRFALFGFNLSKFVACVVWNYVALVCAGSYAFLCRIFVFSALQHQVIAPMCGAHT